MTDALAEYRDFGVELAHEAAEIMRAHGDGSVEKDIKIDESPVTVADTSINTLVIDRINSRYPDHTILGEEESDGNHEEAEFTWVVDPIDGTRPFSMGVPTSVFSLALTQHGDPIVAVVYHPWMDRLYTAVSGGGAYLNGEQIHVNDTSEITIASYYTLAGRHQAWQYSFNKDIESDGAKFMMFGSFVYESMLVASGHFDFSIYAHGKSHDVATAKLIVEEAGGKTSNIEGDEQRYDQGVTGFIASNGQYHDEIVARIAKFRSE